jgi:hypothetical protein
MVPITLPWSTLPNDVRDNIARTIILPRFSIQDFEEEIIKFHGTYNHHTNSVTFRSEADYLLFIIKWS